MGQVLRGDADAGIGDRGGDPFPFAPPPLAPLFQPGLDHHLAFGQGIEIGVHQQTIQHLTDPCLVGIDRRQPRRHFDAQAQAFVLEPLFVRGDNLSDHRFERDRPALELGFARFQAGDIQHVLHQFDQVSGVFFDLGHAVHRARIQRPHGPGKEHTAIALDGRQGRAQLLGHGLDEAALGQVHLPRLPVEAGIFQGDGQRPGHILQPFHIILGEGTIQFVQQFQHPGTAVLNQQRHAQDGTGDKAGLGVHFAEKLVVLIGAVDHHRLVGKSHLSGDPLPQFEPHAPQRFLLPHPASDEFQLLSLFIQEQQ